MTQTRKDPVLAMLDRIDPLPAEAAKVRADWAAHGEKLEENGK